MKKSDNITIPINAKWKLNNKKDSCVTIPADAKWMLGDKKTTYNTIRKYKKRETITTPIDTIVRNIGIYNRRLMIGTAINNCPFGFVILHNSFIISIMPQGFICSNT